jgi:hypothetical protein
VRPSNANQTQPSTNSANDAQAQPSTNVVPRSEGLENVQGSSSDAVTAWHEPNHSSYQEEAPPIVGGQFGDGPAVWKTSYWLMAKGTGQPTLWEPGGPLDKLNQAQSGLANPVQVEINANNAYGLPIIDEKNAEVSLNKDLDGDGIIEPNVPHDIIDNFQRVRVDGDGHISRKVDVSWHGHCNEAALAGLLFEAPAHDATVNGITFSKENVEGLLVKVVDSVLTDSTGWEDSNDVVRLKDGSAIQGTIQDQKDPLPFYRMGAQFDAENGKFTLTGNPGRDLTIKNSQGQETVVPGDQILNMTRGGGITPGGVHPITPTEFHFQVQQILKDGPGGGMDIARGPEKWNYAFHQANDQISATPPPGIDPKTLLGVNGKPISDLSNVSFVTRTMGLSNGSTFTYQYWLEEDDSGAVANSGWIAGTNADGTFSNGRPSSLFTPRKFDWNDPALRTALKGKGIDIDVVKQIYEASIA